MAKELKAQKNSKEIDYRVLKEKNLILKKGKLEILRQVCWSKRKDSKVGLGEMGLGRAFIRGKHATSKSTIIVILYDCHTMIFVFVFVACHDKINDCDRCHHHHHLFFGRYIRIIAPEKHSQTPKSCPTQCDISDTPYLSMFLYFPHLIKF